MSRQANLVTATMATPRRIRPWQLTRPSSRTDHVIGLHVDTERMYAVHTVHAGGVVRIVSVHEADLVPNTLLDGGIREPNRLVEALQGLRTRMVANGVPMDARVVLVTYGHHVIVKRIFLQEITDKEVEDDIHWEAEQYVPFDINNVNLDWEPLTRDREPDEREVLLIAAKCDAVNDLTQAVLDAGWTIDAVECLDQGFQRLIGLSGKDPRNMALVHVGDYLLHLVITNAHGEIGFTRTIGIGRGYLVEKVAKTLECTLAEADALVASLDRPERSRDETHELTERVCIMTIEEMALEVQRSLDFYRTTPPAQVSEILVCGRVAELPAFQRIIGQRLAIPTSPVVLAINVAHRFAVAAGLSLRTHFDDLRTARQADWERAKMNREEKRAAGSGRIVPLVGSVKISSKPPEKPARPFKPRPRELSRFLRRLAQVIELQEFVTDGDQLLVDALREMEEDRDFGSRRFRARILGLIHSDPDPQVVSHNWMRYLYEQFRLPAPIGSILRHLAKTNAAIHRPELIGEVLRECANHIDGEEGRSSLIQPAGTRHLPDFARPHSRAT